jgi:hypothetical protein
MTETGTINVILGPCLDLDNILGPSFLSSVKGFWSCDPCWKGCVGVLRSKKLVASIKLEVSSYQSRTLKVFNHVCKIEMVLFK